jgi:hypothetical protein
VVRVHRLRLRTLGGVGGVVVSVIPHHVRCPECGQKFDMRDSTQAQEWYFGHDCEVSQ